MRIRTELFSMMAAGAFLCLGAIADEAAKPAAKGEVPDCCKPDFLKEPTTAVTDFSTLPLGVTKKEVNVYKDEANPIILVPGTKPVVDVTITYVVRTYDSKIPGKGFTEVPQTVFGRVKFPVIEANKKYNLRIILGLMDVKFEASVEDWARDDSFIDNDGDGVYTPGVDTLVPGGAVTEIDLPANI